jgi:hypothetical protein
VCSEAERPIAVARRDASAFETRSAREVFQLGYFSSAIRGLRRGAAWRRRNSDV